MSTIDVAACLLLLLMGVILMVCVVAPFLKDKMPPPPPEGNHPDCPGQIVFVYRGRIGVTCPVTPGKICLGRYGNDGLLLRAA